LKQAIVSTIGILSPFMFKTADQELQDRNHGIDCKAPKRRPTVDSSLTCVEKGKIMRNAKLSSAAIATVAFVAMGTVGLATDKKRHKAHSEGAANVSSQPINSDTPTNCHRGNNGNGARLICN
jgi:hypothetical protein